MESTESQVTTCLQQRVVGTLYWINNELFIGTQAYCFRAGYKMRASFFFRSIEIENNFYGISVTAGPNVDNAVKHIEKAHPQEVVKWRMKRRSQM